MKRKISVIFFFWVLACICAQQVCEYSADVEKPIVIIIPSYNNAQWCIRNIESVLMQVYGNYRVVYIDDCSTDDTYNHVMQYVQEHDKAHRVTILHNNHRCGALENVYHAIHAAGNHEIIVTLDGDDWFAHAYVLKRINHEYQDEAVWMTYGQFRFWPSNEQGYACSITSDMIKASGGIRRLCGYATHVRTFYAWLFKHIKKEDLLYQDLFFPVTWDKAMMAPMLEMSGLQHARFIEDVLYIYNNNNPLSDARLHGELQNKLADIVFQKPSYEFLDDKMIPGKVADLVIFSFDRPMQLYALLESIDTYIKGLGVITIIYRTSSAEYEKGYQEIIHKYPHIKWYKQGEVPKSDFKPLTIRAVCDTPHLYIMFAVDDIIVKDYIDISECIAYLEQTKAYGFFLRLGKNITYCYAKNENVNVPRCTNIDDNVCMWQFRTGIGDWCYPNTLDMTVYRKMDIASKIKNLHFTSPNFLEGYWAGDAHEVIRKFGLCFRDSKIVNVPLNKVQNDNNNRTMNYLLPHELLDKFMHGLKINIAQFFRVTNSAPHMEYKPEFISR